MYFFFSLFSQQPLKPRDTHDDACLVPGNYKVFREKLQARSKSKT